MPARRRRRADPGQRLEHPRGDRPALGPAAALLPSMETQRETVPGRCCAMWRPSARMLRAVRTCAVGGVAGEALTAPAAASVVAARAAM